jgi:tetratricopeptide (TPR) repeat protein
MVRMLTGLVALGVALSATADETQLKEARARWLAGNYDEARAMYEELAKAEKPPAAAIIGISRCLECVGDYDKAFDVVMTALKRAKNNPDLLAQRASLLYLRGQYAEAEDAANQALAAKPDHFAARWVRGQSYRERGMLEKADADFRWFVRTYSDRSEMDKDITDPEELAFVGQAGIEYARTHNLGDQFHFILNEVYGDAIKADTTYWIVEQLAGELLLEKHNRAEAVESFDKALKLNPRAAEALAGKAMAGLQRFEVKDAEQFLDQALKINPKLLLALRTKADLAVMSGDLGAASKALEQARAVNPRDERTLARVAAVEVLMRRPASVEKIAKEILAINPKPAIFYHELASVLDARRKYSLAETYYQKAIALQPALPWPRNGLGLLYMHTDREDEAKKVLEEAFENDRFNVRVSNSIKVLNHLNDYKTIATANFRVKYNAKTDSILARYMAEVLESLHVEYKSQFGYAPPKPILVEIFSTHEMFSGRVTSLPDLHTIGACTGKMFAMASPKAKGVPRPFNWARVLRHELVHVFNLEQTNMECPHWLTEGLAVRAEKINLPARWNQVLAKSLSDDKLLNLDTITLGFIRPRDQDEWHLAYFQSYLYVTFLTKTYGEKSVGGMLAAYAEELNDDAALRKVCKVDKAAFEKAYREFIQDYAKNLPRGKEKAPGGKPLTLAQLQEAYEMDPDDADTAAKYAERLIVKDPAKARKLVDKILAAKANHTLAAVVKARLLAKAGDTEAAIKVLDAAQGSGATPELLLALGRLLAEADQPEKAAETLEQGRKLEPYESTWLEELAKVYKKTNDKAKRISVLKDLVKFDYDDFPSRKLLAQLLIEQGDFPGAEAAAREAMEIDLLDEEIQEVFFTALTKQNKNEEATRLKKILQD